MRRPKKFFIAYALFASAVTVIFEILYLNGLIVPVIIYSNKAPKTIDDSIVELIPGTKSTKNVTLINLENSDWFMLSENRIFLRNAYYDDRLNVSVVKLLAYKNHNFNCTNELSCLQNGQKLETNCTLIDKAGRSVNHGAYFLECKVDRKPESVTISGYRKNKSQSRSFSISYRTDQYRKWNLGICVKPTYSYNNTRKLEIFLEYYKLLGFEQVFLYKHSWSNSVENLVNSYVNTNYVTVIDWRDFLPPDFNNSLSSDKCFGVRNVDVPIAAGQTLAQSDCGYIHMNSGTKYLAHLDLDEFIVWKQPENFLTQTFLQFLDDEFINNPWAGAVQIRGKFINVFWNFANKTLEVKKDNVTMAPYYRCKEIVKPEAVLRYHIHWVREFVPGLGHKVLPKHKSVLYHDNKIRNQSWPTDESDVFDSQFMSRMLKTLSVILG